jgi:hypothetical protein
MDFAARLLGALRQKRSYARSRLRQGRAIDVKHVRSFTRLTGLGEPPRLADAWAVPPSSTGPDREHSRLLVIGSVATSRHGPTDRTRQEFRTTAAAF